MADVRWPAAEVMAGCRDLGLETRVREGCAAMPGLFRAFAPAFLAKEYAAQDRDHLLDIHRALAGAEDRNRQRDVRARADLFTAVTEQVRDDIARLILGSGVETRRGLIREGDPEPAREIAQDHDVVHPLEDGRRK